LASLTGFHPFSETELNNDRIFVPGPSKARAAAETEPGTISPKLPTRAGAAADDRLAPAYTKVYDGLAPGLPFAL
jgi:hypothetical protein